MTGEELKLDPSADQVILIEDNARRNNKKSECKICKRQVRLSHHMTLTARKQGFNFHIEQADYDMCDICGGITRNAFPYIIRTLERSDFIRKYPQLAHKIR